MVAMLQAPLDEYVPEGRAGQVRTRAVPARVIPLHPGQAPQGHVHQVRDHRQSSPRVTRSHGAAVYWRRRLVATALGLGVLLTAAHAGAALGGTTTAPERSPHVEQVIVREGDTLWSVAERLAPHSDPRAVVDDLTAARGSSSVQPGELITWSK